MVIQYLKQVGKEKKFDKWVPHVLTENQKKIIVLKCHLLLILPNHKETFLDWIVTCNEKWFYMTASDNQLSGWTKKKRQSTSQRQTCTREGSWPPFGGVWPTTAFWIPVKPLHLRSMRSKSMGCTDDCNSCNQHWSIERAHFFSTTMPDHISHNQRFKSWTTWATKFCLIRHIHLTSRQPVTTCSSISTTFCRENASTTSRRQKMFSKKFVEPWSMDFYATGINKLISHWQKYVDCHGSYFD